MARTLRSAIIGAVPEAVWPVVADPHHLPRWWPGVQRVENVGAGRFTEVIPTRRGKPVRLDFHILESSPPHLCRWSQEVAGTPFERLLSSWTTTVRLESDGLGRCRVTLEEHQQLRGSLRLGGLLQRRPAARRLEAALTALAALF
jgi:uncharacterized protein YndB with AHSA1/START domain